MNEKKTKPQLWEEIRKYEQLQLWTEQFLEERGLLQEYNKYINQKRRDQKNYLLSKSADLSMLKQVLLGLFEL